MQNQELKDVICQIVKNHTQAILGWYIILRDLFNHKSIILQKSNDDDYSPDSYSLRIRNELERQKSFEQISHSKSHIDGYTEAKNLLSELPKFKPRSDDSGRDTDVPQTAVYKTVQVNPVIDLHPARLARSEILKALLAISLE